MDWGYMGELMLSMLIFAPGLIVFGVLLLVGVAMMLERSGVLGSLQSSKVSEAEDDLAVANPDSGEIVSSLRDAVEAERTSEEGELEEKSGT